MCVFVLCTEWAVAGWPIIVKASQGQHPLNPTILKSTHTQINPVPACFSANGPEIYQPTSIIHDIGEIGCCTASRRQEEA